MAPSPRTRKILFFLLAASSLLLAAAILADWLPLLRGPSPETKEWYWPYLLRPARRWWPSLATAVVMWLVGAWWITRDTPRRSQVILALIGLAISSFALQLAIIYADRQAVAAELVDRTLSHLSSGFFMAAVEIEDINSSLRQYPVEMPTFISEHARTHPPGLVIANWLTIEALGEIDGMAEFLSQRVQPLRCTDLWLLDRAASVSAALGIWALLPLLFASATVFPAYLVAAELLQARAVPLATTLAAALPALIIFAPKSVQIYAPLGLLMFWTFHTGLCKLSPWRLLLAGFIGSVLTFFSLGNVTLYFLLLLYALVLVRFLLRRGALQPIGAGRFAGLFLAFCLGAASIWVMFWLIWGVAPWEIAVVGLGQHYELVTNLRNYRWWVSWNLLDLMVFSGWPVALGFLGGLVLAFRMWRQRSVETADMMAVVLAIFILVLDLSGSARGEVGRLWLFFMPLLAFVAGRFWAQVFPSSGETVTVLALQLLMVLCLGLAWESVRPAIIVAEEPLQRRAAMENSLDVSLANEPLHLAGFTLESSALRAGEDLSLTLFWRAEGPASRPYTVFNHLVDGQGQLRAQQDNWPVEGQWPPTCWRAGDLIVDDYIIALPDDLEPGTYYLLTGMYDGSTGQRALYDSGQDATELTTIEIVPK